jgi:hypothetical protein
VVVPESEEDLAANVSDRVLFDFGKAVVWTRDHQEDSR